MNGTQPAPAQILVVDDDDIVRHSVGAYLEDSGFEVREADNGQLAVDSVRERAPDVVLLDLRMPGLDGLEVLAILAVEFPELPVIIVTGAGVLDDAIEALRRGAWDFVTKPIQEMAILEHAIRRALERAQLIRDNRRYHQHLEEQIELRTGQLKRELTERRRVEEALKKSLDDLRKVMDGTIHALSLMGEMRDPYTAGHQRRVANLAAAIANELDLPPERVEGTYIGGLLHDIGKISVPIEILTKPGGISDLEYAMIQRHPQVGYDILKEIEFTQPIADFVHQHHERLDGGGYPLGLKGEELRLESCILAVADVVEAMSSHRPYRAGLGIDEALREVEKFKGVRYHSAVVDACMVLIRDKGFAFEDPFG